MKKTMTVVIGIVLAGLLSMGLSARKPAKCQQLQADLYALASFHEQQQYGDFATPEVVTALQSVVADERALADAACQ